MKNNDIELIRLTLDGDDTAFAKLVEKYRSAVHALVWRKIGDFHIAEEITQDVFLHAYNQLGSIKKPQSFASWLYVSASRRCLAWHRKKRLPMKSFEDISEVQDEDTTYSQFVVNENQRVSEEAQRDVVKKLLAKLPESERTVLTLHYFSEMSSFEIGAFLGVSANTIRSRLRRALQRLRKEEPMIREALEHFQISPNITENIMREVSHLKPTPSGSKPIIPWIVAASSAVLLLLMLGAGSQFLAYFQKPYSVDAQSEMMVELIDTSIVLNLDLQPSKQNQFGSANELVNSNNNGQQQENESFAAAHNDGVDDSAPEQQWIPATPIKGSSVSYLHATPDGELYAHNDEMNIFKLPADGSEWQYLCNVESLPTAWSPSFPIAKWNDTLYILPDNELFASKDDGKTWELIYRWEDRYGISNIYPTEQALYVVFVSGILRSEDNGKTWIEMIDGMNGNPISIIKFQNVLFAATDSGLFRLKGDLWERVELPDPSVGRILSIATAGKKLYVATAFSFEAIGGPTAVFQGKVRGWWIFRSTDVGNTWKDITPNNAWPQKAAPPQITLLAAGETLIAMENGMVRSTDAGDTWLPPSSMNKHYSSPALTQNDHVFYIGGKGGLHRSTDDGVSWNMVNIPQAKKMSPIENLIVFGENSKQHIKPTIYARFPNDHGRFSGEIVETSNNGKSWQSIQMEIEPMTERSRKTQPSISHIVKSDGVIYAKGGTLLDVGGTKVYRISRVNSTLVPIQDIPPFDEGLLHLYYVHQIQKQFPKDFALEQKKKMKEMSFGAKQFFKQLTELDEKQPNASYARMQKSHLFTRGLLGPFAVSNDTIYMEYNFKLYRWTIGETKWYDTGLEETTEIDTGFPRIDLKLAVSGDTVYAGKRDGHLVVSFDRGNNWTNLTSALPFTVRSFKDIIVDGSTVYVATDAGIIHTDDGRSWHTIMDATGANLVMEHITVDNSVLYGITQQTGIYRLENGNWQQVVSNTPENATSLAVSGDTIYIGTEYNEMFHYMLEE
ncbi:sigma-70 family RNA polymerase sigma factor [Candidatus Poribacteria bacterium]|nr:sigma-70 family RNA polymerase sigma factor [Candidatus Poribacteria bacterium]MYB65275.1 sigma-70 family RNA polymerase sigma factor [Candidatus Poribacteria bacterium]